MANNRLYLRCKNCGKTLYLSKNFGEPYYIGEKKVEELNQFFEDHAYCGKSHELAHGGWFELLDEYHNSDDPKYEITAIVANALREK